MLPSKNLLSPKKMLPMYTLSNESALGLLNLSTAKSNKKAIKYNTKADVIRDWQSGKLKEDDNVEVG